MIQITISKRAAIILAVALLLAIPGAVAAQSIFEDVADTNVHLEGIEYLREVGITQGCTATEFCPEDPVSRAQIASFLYRLSGNDPLTQPSVNAAELDGTEAAAYALDPKLTRIHYDQAVNSGVPDAFFSKAADIGTFTKSRPATDIMLFWNANAVATGGYCEWQLRIDGLRDDGLDSPNTANATGSSGLLDGTAGQLGVIGHFQGILGLGEHTVSVWVRGTASNCTLNTHNIGQDLYVMETDRIIGQGSSLLVSEEG